MSELLKKQNYGVEVEFTGISRKMAADAVAEIIGTTASRPCLLYTSPFASDEKIKDTARRYINEGKGIEKLLPFLDSGNLDEFAAAAYKKDGKKGLVKFLPFLDEDDVKDVYKRQP